MSVQVDILLVDDESRNLDALESILSNPGYRLLRAEDADRALRLLLDNQVAVIVLDIKMPGVSGFELARMIKNTKRFRETPIVFLTAYMLDDQDVIAGYGAGGVDYLTKPVNPDILRQKVAVFAELHRKTCEFEALNKRLAELNESLETRVRERTAELEASQAALVASGRQKDEFIAILAHELRNPLAPLRTGLDLLAQYEPTPAPPVARTRAAMNRQLDHIVRLIDDLLDVSRISRGLLQLRRERIDLATAIAAAVENTRAGFERRKQKLSVELASGLSAFADETRIVQIITNLLHNACKFTPDAGTIAVELEAEGGYAVVRVADSGIGIPPAQLERVFDMFVRITRSGASAQIGLGIGLALARQLADMHGGTLSADSQGEGRGTTFTLRIPRVDGAEVKAAVAEPIAARSRPLEIVVVEDSSDIAQGLEDLLRVMQHRVLVADSGPTGLELIRRTRPDVVLCDLGLPGLDGLDVCRQIRAERDAPQPVMVALTGWGREDDRRRTKEAGFDRHLVKPVTAEALRAVLSGINVRSQSNGKSASGDTHGH